MIRPLGLILSLSFAFHAHAESDWTLESDHHNFTQSYEDLVKEARSKVESMDEFIKKFSENGVLRTQWAKPADPLDLCGDFGYHGSSDANPEADLFKIADPNDRQQQEALVRWTQTDALFRVETDHFCNLWPGTPKFTLFGLTQSALDELKLLRKERAEILALLDHRGAKRRVLPIEAPSPSDSIVWRADQFKKTADAAVNLITNLKTIPGPQQGTVAYRLGELTGQINRALTLDGRVAQFSLGVTEANIPCRGELVQAAFTYRDALQEFSSDASFGKFTPVFIAKMKKGQVHLTKAVRYCRETQSSTSLNIVGDVLQKEVSVLDTLLEDISDKGALRSKWKDETAPFYFCKKLATATGSPDQAVLARMTNVNDGNQGSYFAELKDVWNNLSVTAETFCGFKQYPGYPATGQLSFELFAKLKSSKDLIEDIARRWNDGTQKSLSSIPRKTKPNYASSLAQLDTKLDALVAEFNAFMNKSTPYARRLQIAYDVGATENLAQRLVEAGNPTPECLRALDYVAVLLRTVGYRFNRTNGTDSDYLRYAQNGVAAAKALCK